MWTGEVIDSSKLGGKVVEMFSVWTRLLLWLKHRDSHIFGKPKEIFETDISRQNIYVIYSKHFVDL